MKFNIKWHFAFPRLYLQVTNVLTTLWQIFLCVLLGVSSDTINPIDYTMIQNSH